MNERAHEREPASGKTTKAAGRDRSEERLQNLIAASATVVERLDLEIVLRRIVEAGMKLVGARYGALGVIGADRSLERFIHVGIDPHTAEQIGHLPEGHGVLGAVITDRTPIRLKHMTEHPRSTGFPEHHPTMESFLGVPVQVGGEIYGNLYLTESENESFTREDEELIVALADMAGIAIENARLYDISKTREVWNATIADVMGAMLDATGENVLDVIAERVAAFIDADLVAVAIPLGTENFTLSNVHGSRADSLRGRIYPAAGTLAARALSSRQAVSIGGQSAAVMVEWQPDLGPTVAIPLFASQEPLGVLTVSRGLGGTDFTPADLEMAFAFAAQASIALEVVRAREDRRRLDTALDRARIARDLHDSVIQQLFGAGLALQSAAAISGPETALAIDAQIGIIDTAIKDIRTIIFALSTSDRVGEKRLRDRLLDVVTDVTGTWPTPPRISFDGPLDTAIPTDLADDLVVVLRELLTNVVKHSHATKAGVTVSLLEGLVRLSVEDDGVGIPGSALRSGLANLADRAVLRGGRCSAKDGESGGTRVEWIVPLAQMSQEQP